MILIPLYHRSPRTNAQHRQLGDASNESRSCGSAFGRGTIVKWYVTWYRPYSHMYICCLFRRLPTSWRWTAPWLPWTRLKKILVSAQFAAFGLSGDEKRCWWPGPSTSRNGSGGHMPMPSKFKKMNWLTGKSYGTWCCCWSLCPRSGGSWSNIVWSDLYCHMLYCLVIKQWKAAGPKVLPHVDHQDFLWELINVLEFKHTILMHVVWQP